MIFGLLGAAEAFGIIAADKSRKLTGQHRLAHYENILLNAIVNECIVIHHCDKAHTLYL